jgi:quercetin dioxygenase-like cupin family protein
MRIIDVGPDQGHEVTHYGSHGLRAHSLLRADRVAVTMLRVAAGGEIGRHPAVVDQLFLVVAGYGVVCGNDGVWHPIAAGQAAIWAAGEPHTTRAAEDLVAVVVETPRQN